MWSSVERFIQRENIRNFKKRLEAATDEGQRETLLALLAEEEAKAVRLAQADDGDAKPTQSPKSRVG
jgi:hypothetical protein